MNEFYNKIQYFESTEKIPTKIYYHYTSLDALFSIVTSKTFRLTSLKSSNDKKELYYKPEEFISNFSNICNNEKDESTKKYLYLVEESIKNNEQQFFEECKKKVSPYALCLSEKKDNLTHWDRYASGCTGVCIGFNTSSLEVHMQRMAITAFGVGLYDVGKVFYSLEQKEKYIRSIVIKIMNALKDALSKKRPIEKGDITGIIQENGYIYAAVAYMRLMKFSKNSSFMDEDEVRLYHDSTSIKDTLNLIDQVASSLEPELQKNLKKNFMEFVKQLHLREERFFMAKSGIRSYKELCLEEVWGSGAIPEIVLGPLCIQNRNELKRFLKANGLEGTKISVSQVPIR